MKVKIDEDFFGKYWVGLFFLSYGAVHLHMGQYNLSLWMFIASLYMLLHAEKEIELRCADRALKELEARIDRLTTQQSGSHPAPCAGSCEAQAFKIEIRALQTRIGGEL